MLHINSCVYFCYRGNGGVPKHDIRDWALEHGKILYSGINEKFK